MHDNYVLRLKWSVSWVLMFRDQSEEGEVQCILVMFVYNIWKPTFSLILLKF